MGSLRRCGGSFRRSIRLVHLKAYTTQGGGENFGGYMHALFSGHVAKSGLGVRTQTYCSAATTVPSLQLDFLHLIDAILIPGKLLPPTYGIGAARGHEYRSLRSRLHLSFSLVRCFKAGAGCPGPGRPISDHTVCCMYAQSSPGVARPTWPVFSFSIARATADSMQTADSGHHQESWRQNSASP